MAWHMPRQPTYDLLLLPSAGSMISDWLAPYAGDAHGPMGGRRSVPGTSAVSLADSGSERLLDASTARACGGWPRGYWPPSAFLRRFR